MTGHQLAEGQVQREIGADVRTNERAGRQRWMMDGVDRRGCRPALSRQHKQDLLG